MKVYTESIQAFRCGGWEVRVWRKKDKGVSLEPDEDVEKALGEMQGEMLMVIAGVLLKMEGVNAVEVKDGDGMGCVVYKDWP